MGGCLSSQDKLVGYGDDVSHLRPRAEPEFEPESTATRAQKSFAVSKRYENEVREGGQPGAFELRSAAPRSKGSFLEALATSESNLNGQGAWRGAGAAPALAAAGVIRGDAAASTSGGAAAGAAADGGGDLAALPEASQDSFEIARAETARELAVLSRSFRQGSASAWDNDGGDGDGDGAGDDGASLDAIRDAGGEGRGREPPRCEARAQAQAQGRAAASAPGWARDTDPPQSWPRLQGHQADAVIGQASGREEQEADGDGTGDDGTGDEVCPVGPGVGDGSSQPLACLPAGVRDVAYSRAAEGPGAAAGAESLPAGQVLPGGVEPGGGGGPAVAGLGLGGPTAAVGPCSGRSRGHRHSETSFMDHQKQQQQQHQAGVAGGDTDSPGRPGRASRSSDVGFYFEEARRVAAAAAGGARTQSQPGELPPDGGGAAARHGAAPVRHSLLESPLGRQLASRGGDGGGGGGGAAGGRGGGGGGSVDYTPSPDTIRQPSRGNLLLSPQPRLRVGVSYGHGSGSGLTSGSVTPPGGVSGVRPQPLSANVLSRGGPAAGLAALMASPAGGAAAAAAAVLGQWASPATAAPPACGANGLPFRGYGDMGPVDEQESDGPQAVAVQRLELRPGTGTGTGTGAGAGARSTAHGLVTVTNAPPRSYQSPLGASASSRVTSPQVLAGRGGSSGLLLAARATTGSMATGVGPTGRGYTSNGSPHLVSPPGSVHGGAAAPRSARLAGALLGATGAAAAANSTGTGARATTTTGAGAGLLRHMSSSSRLTERPFSGASSQHSSQQQLQLLRQQHTGAVSAQGAPTSLASPLAAKPASQSAAGSRSKLLASPTAGAAASSLPHSESRGSMLLGHLQSRLDEQQQHQQHGTASAPLAAGGGGGGWDFSKKTSHDQLPMSGVISGVLPGSTRGSADGGGGGSVQGGSSRMAERASRLLASLHRLGAVAPVGGGQPQ